MSQPVKLSDSLVLDYPAKIATPSAKAFRPFRLECLLAHGVSRGVHSSAVRTPQLTLWASKAVAMLADMLAAHHAISGGATLADADQIGRAHV